jgi:hypothetical protein
MLRGLVTSADRNRPMQIVVASQRRHLAPSERSKSTAFSTSLFERHLVFMHGRIRLRMRHPLRVLFRGFPQTLGQ